MCIECLKLPLYFIKASVFKFEKQHSCVCRGFCCPRHEGTRGKAVHQAEETSRILGSTPLSEPVGFHHSGAGSPPPSLHQYPQDFTICGNVCCFRQMSTGPASGLRLSTTWTWVTWCLIPLLLSEYIFICSLKRRFNMNCYRVSQLYLPEVKFIWFSSF